MAGTRQNIESNEANVSSTSYLLGSGNARFSYTGGTSVRSVTPVEEIIRQNWYYTLLSTLLEQWENIQNLRAGKWSAISGGKLEAIFRCCCLPCSVLTRAINGRRRHSRQTGIMYLYVYICATIVLNLVVAFKNIHLSTAEDIQKYTEILWMSVAIIMMLYLLVFTYQTVEFSRSRGKLLRLFYEGGTSIFGLASLGFSICVVIDNISCGQALDAVVAGVKAIFTIIQILFLHYFYEAIIPKNTPHIEILLAHLLGTNLGLWFWTLCSEQADEMLERCIHYPLPLGQAEKFCTPLFIEYLLLAASLFFQIWTNMLRRETELTTNTDRSRSDTDSTPNAWLGYFIGGFFAAVFLILVIMSEKTGEGHQDYHIADTVGIFILYFIQVLACYICQLSLQSHQRNTDRIELDHEDVLLYFSLVGILLWEGLHSYGLILNGLNHNYEVLDLVKDILGISQYIFQTATLINLRRHQRTHGQSSIWICECILFLLVTNLLMWAHDSFFIDVKITTPGEILTKIEMDLKPVGYIVHPFAIFFRFHSAVCCVVAYNLF